jgi:hypothetical protein
MRNRLVAWTMSSVIVTLALTLFAASDENVPGAALKAVQVKEPATPGVDVTFASAPRPNHGSGAVEALGASPNALRSASARLAGNARSQQGHGVTLLVDGSKTPDAVPSQLAFRHFVSVIATSAFAADAETKRRDAYLSLLVGLSSPDRDALRAAVAGVQEQLSAAERGESSSTEDGGVRPAEARARVLDEAVARVRSMMSAEGVAVVQKHVDEHVRRRIKIFGTHQ